MPSVPASHGESPSCLGAFFRRLAFLLPPSAGLALGVGVNALLADDYALQSVWTGASVDSLPNAWLVKASGVLAATLVWFTAAYLLRAQDGFVPSLRRVAFGFTGFLSILCLNTLEAFTGAAATYWSLLAAIFSLAFLAAWLVALALKDASPSALRLHRVVDSHALALVVALGIFYFGVSWAMSLLQYRAVRISYHDCAGFDEMLWRTLHGQFLSATVFGDRCFLGQHLEFIHLFLLPLYLLAPGLPVLMLTQSLGLASGVIPLYLLVNRKIGSRFAAFCFCAAYLCYAPMQYTEKRLIFETYLPENLAVPILLWVLYFFDSGNMKGLLLSSFLAAACKEDMVLPVAMIGIVLALRGNWRWGLPIFFGALFWFLAALLFVIPYFEAGPSHVLPYFSAMGGSVGAILRKIVYEPLYTLKFVFSFQRVDFLLMMLVPMGLLALLSPTAVFIFLPSIASNSLASWSPSSSIYYHYHISLVPFAVGGAVFGAANLMKFLPRLSSLWGPVRMALRPEITAAFCGILVLTCSLAGDVVYGKFPLSLKFYNPRSPAYWRHLYVATPRARFFVREVLPTVPRDAKVCSSQFLATRFTHHAATFVYPHHENSIDSADYLVFEHDAPDNPSTTYYVSPVLNGDENLDDFDLVLDRNGISVYKRRLTSANGNALE